jgi:hypothetical protein
MLATFRRARLTQFGTVAADSRVEAAAAHEHPCRQQTYIRAIIIQADALYQRLYLWLTQTRTGADFARLGASKRGINTRLELTWLLHSLVLLLTNDGSVTGSGSSENRGSIKAAER